MRSGNGMKIWKKDIRDVLMICETWKDAASLAAHEQAAHFTTLVPKIQELAAMKLEKFEFFQELKNPV